MTDPVGLRLRKILIDYLVENPSTSFASLHSHAITALGRRITPQAVYQLMRRLGNEGVVLKEKGCFSLRLSWVHNIMMLAARLQERYLETPPTELLHDSKFKAQRWTVPDLAKADDLWVNLILAMFNRSQSSTMYSWLPHPWYHLIHHTAELNLQKILRRNDKELWLLVGGDSYLDRAYTNYWDSKVYRYKFAAPSAEFPPSAYINVIDDLVLKIQLPQDLHGQLEALYREVTSAEDLLPGRVFELLSRKSRIQITLRRNAAAASRIKKYFQALFQA